MYFLRLAKLKPAVEQVAAEAWDDLEVSGFLQFYNVRTAMGKTGGLMKVIVGCLDCRREAETGRSSARCAAGGAVLGGWDRLHGHASEAEHS